MYPNTSVNREVGDMSWNDSDVAASKFVKDGGRSGSAFDFRLCVR